jgi:hypothetical protein
MKKEEYELLKKQFKLPDFSALDKEFEISDIEETSFPFRNIVRKMADKIDSITAVYEDILHPETNVASMQESAAFADEDRESLMKTYSLLMFYFRGAAELAIDDSDDLNVRFINDVWTAWPGLKKEILPFMKKLKDSWKSSITKKGVVGYLG